jgi:hypothetical protein
MNLWGDMACVAKKEEEQEHRMINEEGTIVMKGRQSLSPCWPAVVAPRISNLVVTLSLARSEEHREIRGISLVYFLYLCTGNDCIVDSEDLRVTSPVSGWVIPASQ